MTAIDWTRKVFRSRKLPNLYSTPHEVRGLLSEVLDVAVDDVIIYSLARSSDRWEDPGRQEWEFAAPRADNVKILLDCHFKGLTVLNDVKPDEHHSDCIAISGLASHPFGSWQPHGPNKSYMWIRDELPEALPGIRAFTYGYESNLSGSDSFQSISDIALGIIHHLKSGGWNLSTSKPILFLAHSLGGIILKQALVYIAEGEASTASILANFRGAIMFGVPSLGMQQSHLMAMVQGQANDVLVQDLSRENGSNYLRQLNKSFEGISFTRTARIFWAYETKESVTTMKLPDGSWSRNGPPSVLVNPDSATNHRGRDSKTKALTVPINENHTNMVKFTRADPNLSVIISTLTELCAVHDQTLETAHTDPTLPPMIGSPTTLQVPTNPEEDKSILEDKKIVLELGRILSSLEDLKKNIKSEELDFRVSQIEEPFQDTFKWIFHLPLFSNWLQYGSGLFWIHGKPGSGKSTLMKFICQSPETWQLLHSWTKSSIEVSASFFFHYRGSALQKSFEGILRSLVIQILSHYLEPFKRKHQAIWDEYVSCNKEKEQLSREHKHMHARLQNAKLHVAEGREDAQNNASSQSKRMHKKLQNADSHVAGGREDTQNNASSQSKDPPPDVKNPEKRVQITVEDLEKQLKALENDLQKIGNTINSELPGWAQHFRPYLESSETVFLSELIQDFQHDNDNFMSKLEKMLRRLLNQDTVAMDLILFFDALDEFDGNLDMICRFLKELVDIRPGSKTRARICFSSRPWKKLHDHFSTYCNFALQDHTRSDIERYAMSSLVASRVASPSVVSLTPIIITKANGVFLWVKLAVQELSKAVLAAGQPLSRDDLEKTLWGLPDDLEDFYTLIIERINHFYRREAYVLLELLVRQNEPPSLAEHIRGAVLVSRCTSLNEARSRLVTDRRTFKTASESQKWERIRTDLVTWSGGLVELRGEIPEFMHQTVLEFSMRLSFKRIVLGDAAPFMAENGHSFHFKYWLSVWSLGLSSTELAHVQERTAYHGERSELTTGNSHIDFISGIHSDQIQQLLTLSNQLIASNNALLLFIIINNLSLCLNDWLAKRPGELTNLTSQYTFFPLLSLVISGPSIPASHDIYLSMARTLLENGFRTSKNPEFFATLLWKLFNGNSTPSNPLLGSTSLTTPHQLSSKVLESLVTLIIQHGQDIKVPLTLQEPPSTIIATALHVASPAICAILIDKRVDVNAPDWNKRTALDWVLQPPLEVVLASDMISNCAWRYEKCKILLDAGGVSTYPNARALWERMLGEFEKEGYHTEDLRKRATAIVTPTWPSIFSNLFSVRSWVSPALRRHVI